MKVRELRSAIGPEDLREALGGPWRYESKLSSLGWDVSGEKLHAYRAIAPTRDKTPAGVPGRGLARVPRAALLPGAHEPRTASHHRL